MQGPHLGDALRAHSSQIDHIGVGPGVRAFDEEDAARLLGHRIGPDHAVERPTHLLVGADPEGPASTTDDDTGGGQDVENHEAREHGFPSDARPDG